jgi:hypothetical protein
MLIEILNPSDPMHSITRALFPMDSENDGFLPPFPTRPTASTACRKVEELVEVIKSLLGSHAGWSV